MNKKTKRVLKTILKFGVTGIALFFVFRQIEFASLFLLYKQSNIAYLILAMLFFIFSKVIAAFRLQLFFKRIALDITHNTNLRLYLLGMFYNLFLPGGIGGDGYKIYLLQKNYKLKTTKLFGAILADRLSGMTALFILAVIIFSVLDIQQSWQVYSLLLVPVIYIGFYLFLRGFYQNLTSIFGITSLYSIGVQLLQLICVWMTILAFGEHRSIFIYLLVFLISSIVAILPVSVGGVGLRELTFLYGAQLLGVNQEFAVSISLMFYLITALVSFGGIWFVVKPIRFKPGII